MMATILNNKDLMARLVSVQNHPINASRDIMSIVGLMETRAELLAHVEACEGALFDCIGPDAYRKFDMSRPDECFSGCEIAA